ncbi:Ribokinase-like protein [Trichophaea hybrida]|nr:Ribokinase-like protein [Trichophaea hybrida]
MPHILGLGALYEDIVLSVPHLSEDSKIRATHKEVRIGGNIINTFEVLLDAPQFPGPPLHLEFFGAVGTPDSCQHVYTDLTSRGITPRLLHRDSPGTASAYIICSQTTGSRTIISDSNELEDASAEELRCEFHDISAKWPEWIHVEGRNCTAVLEFLREIKALGFGGSISVDFERDMEGLRDLVAVADVLFISQTYAQVLVGTEKTFADDAEFVGEVLKAIEKEVKPGASGHILLGARGSFCFGWNGNMDNIASSANFVRCSICFVVADCRMDRLPESEVVETVGAGDTFIAGVIWASLKGQDWLRANLIGSMVARRKCTKKGFNGLWLDIGGGILEAEAQNRQRDKSKEQKYRATR